MSIDQYNRQKKFLFKIFNFFVFVWISIKIVFIDNYPNMEYVWYLVASICGLILSICAFIVLKINKKLIKDWDSTIGVLFLVLGTIYLSIYFAQKSNLLDIILR